MGTEKLSWHIFSPELLRQATFPTLPMRSNLQQVLPLQDNLWTTFFSPELLRQTSSPLHFNLQQVLPLQDNLWTTFFSPELLRQTSSPLHFYLQQVLPLQDNLWTTFSHLGCFALFPLQCVPICWGSEFLEVPDKENSFIRNFMYRTGGVIFFIDYCAAIRDT